MNTPKFAIIQNDQLIITHSSKSYNIYDIAFIEIIPEKIEYKKYCFIALIIIDLLFYYSTNFDFFLNVYAVSIIIFSLLYIININPLRWHLLISFKEFKHIQFQLQKKQLSDAENLIEEYKIQYEIIDNLNRKKNIEKLTFPTINAEPTSFKPINNKIRGNYPILHN